MKRLYSLSIHILVLVIRLASLFNEKAKQATQGREQWRKKLKDVLRNNQNEILWIHVSSLGEFEQARPLIIHLKSDYPEYKILLTFFSPSGYNACQSFPYADWMFYMPYDTVKNAKDFLDIVKPKYVFFIKYEFWLNFLFEINRRKNYIKCFLISSVFRKHQPFFKWYGKIFRKALEVYDIIFVQDELSLRLLKLLGKDKNVHLSGDTRIDRVIEIAKQKVSLPIIEDYCKNYRIVIIGSSWPADEKVFVPALAKLKGKHTIRYIIAPHHPDKKNINKLSRLLEKYSLTYCKYTTLSSNDKITTDVLIIDTVGILNKLYRYADIAYIGGGFSDGIHNILEPAVYNIPVLFGPRYEKFYEAEELIKLKGAFCVRNENDLFDYLNELLNNKGMYTHTQSVIKSFIEEHQGAVEKTMVILNREIVRKL